MTSAAATLWDDTFSRRLHVWTATAAIVDVRYSKDGRRVAVAAFDGTVDVYDAKTGGRVTRIRELGEAPRSVSLSADGGIVTVGHRNSIRAWNANDGATLSVIPILVDTESYEAAVDGKQFAVASNRGPVEVWTTIDGARFTILAGHQSYLIDTEFSLGDKRLLTSADDGTAKKWNLVTRTPPTFAPFLGGYLEVTNIAVSRDGALLAIADRRAVRVYDAATGQGAASPSRAVPRYERGAVARVHAGRPPPDVGRGRFVDRTSGTGERMPRRVTPTARRSCRVRRSRRTDRASPSRQRIASSSTTSGAATSHFPNRRPAARSSGSRIRRMTRVCSRGHRSGSCASTQRRTAYRC